MSRDRASLLQAVYQLHRAVMLNEQSRGEFADCRFGAFRQAMYRKQQLMLLRLKAMLFRRGFAEMKELPDLSAELGQVPVLSGREIVLH